MTAVVIQGGAMRSIYCVGAVRALVETGQADAVTSVHVASAGCVAGTILAMSAGGATSNDVRDMASRVLDRLGGKRFIDERRIRRVVDVDYLVDVILDSTGLTPAGLRARGLDFEVVLTTTEGKAVYYDLARRPSFPGVADALRATMAIPVLYPPKAFVDGIQYFDGGIADPLPLLRAARRAPELIVSISSVAEGTLADAAGTKEATILRVAPLPGLVKHLMLSRNPLADATEAFLDEGNVGGIPIVRISPTRPELLGDRLETDLDRLLALEELGFQDALAALGRGAIGVAG